MTEHEHIPANEGRSLTSRFLAVPGVKPGLAVSGAVDVLRYGNEMPHNMNQLIVDSFEAVAIDIAITGFCAALVYLRSINHKNEHGS